MNKTARIYKGMGGSQLSVLVIQNLSYAFAKEKMIFENLTLDVKAGEFISIIGPSGSGKSTLFKIIAGLIEPKQGEIQLYGETPYNRLGRIGYMPQNDLLLPWRTVLENVLLPIEIRKENRGAKLEEVRDWLTRFGLADYEKSYPHELSGGMKQRVAFLRTMTMGRELLLLDEPFGALDSLTKRTMQNWLLNLWGELQKTVLFITHDLEEAILLSDRIYVLGGKGRAPKEVKIELPRPRNSELIYKPAFQTLRKELEWHIHHE
jgi:putative hydroxymethylpyrimidine transport system ATP-binding protein